MRVPLVSVIIPTYNRRASLLRTLESLSQQTYPADSFEVIVVDDGSSDETRTVATDLFPYQLHYVRQENQGATAARNRGALLSRSEFLVFVDDDIRLHSCTLECLLAKLDGLNTIALGTLITPSEITDSSAFACSQRMAQSTEMTDRGSETISFQECMTGLLGLRREHFFALGAFQDPTGGWPNWDDVDFGYRASQQGYRLIRVRDAVAEHWDHTLADLLSACERWRQASRSGARLLARHPALENYIPMFRDKKPIAWRLDPWLLILRKLARQVASSQPTMWAMERLTPAMERHIPKSTTLHLFYRWIISGYIHRGFREGLRDLNQATAIYAEVTARPTRCDP